LWNLPSFMIATSRLLSCKTRTSRAGPPASKIGRPLAAESAAETEKNRSA